MRDAVICSPVRTAVGRFGGVFKDLSAHKLGATLVSELFERIELPKNAVDDVLFGV
jgi:acetyl-CoA C-acetyltransferase